MGSTTPSGQRRDIVVIGGSAGALEPLKRIIEDIPATLPMAVLVTLHLNPKSSSTLAPLLTRVGGLPAVSPDDGDPLLPGYVYVATPNRHLDMVDGELLITSAPRVHGTRPSIDVLFQAAAEAHGPRVIGVILSGGLDDGVAGLAAIQAAGGATIIQHPDEATVASMPRNAINRVRGAEVMRSADIGKRIVRLFGAAPDGASRAQFDGHRAGSPESALWAGVRSLEEQAAMAGVMANRAEKNGDDAERDRYRARRELASANAVSLRKLLHQRD